MSRGGLVELHHNRVMMATHVRRHPPEKEPMVMRRRGRPRRAPKESVVVTAGRWERVDPSPAPTIGRATPSEKEVQVSVVGDSVQISFEGKLVCTHPSARTAQSARGHRQPRRQAEEDQSQTYRGHSSRGYRTGHPRRRERRASSRVDPGVAPKEGDERFRRVLPVPHVEVIDGTPVLDVKTVLESDTTLP